MPIHFVLGLKMMCVSVWGVQPYRDCALSDKGKFETLLLVFASPAYNLSSQGQLLRPLHFLGIASRGTLYLCKDSL